MLFNEDEVGIKIDIEKREINLNSMLQHLLMLSIIMDNRDFFKWNFKE